MWIQATKALVVFTPPPFNCFPCPLGYYLIPATSGKVQSCSVEKWSISKQNSTAGMRIQPPPLASQAGLGPKHESSAGAFGFTVPVKDPSLSLCTMNDRSGTSGSGETWGRGGRGGDTPVSSWTTGKLAHKPGVSAGTLVTAALLKASRLSPGQGRTFVFVFLCKGGLALLECVSCIPALLWGREKRRRRIRVDVQEELQLTCLSH